MTPRFARFSANRLYSKEEEDRNFYKSQGLCRGREIGIFPIPRAWEEAHNFSKSHCLYRGTVYLHISIYIDRDIDDLFNLFRGILNFKFFCFFFVPEVGKWYFGSIFIQEPVSE